MHALAPLNRWFVSLALAQVKTVFRLFDCDGDGFISCAGRSITECTHGISCILADVPLRFPCSDQFMRVIVRSLLDSSLRAYACLPDLKEILFLVLNGGYDWQSRREREEQGTKVA